MKRKTKTFTDWLIEQVKKADIAFDSIPRASVKERLKLIEEEEGLSGRNVTVSVRFDNEDVAEIDKIALFERARPGLLLRLWIHEKIRSFTHNRDFKKWLKERKEAKKK